MDASSDAGTAPAGSLLAAACFVLVRTEGPVNLGMVARLCGNLGVTDLRLVAPVTEVDCDESRKFSTHGKPLLLSAPVYPDLRTAVADCGLIIGSSARPRGAEIGPAMRLHELPQLLSRRPIGAGGRWAMVFGNEAKGLNEDELRACQAYVQLDTPGHITSYNLAMAVAIIGYHLAAMVMPDPPAEVPPAAPRAHIASLERYWVETLDRFHYFRRADADRFAPLFERFLNRLHLSVHDVQVLRGMLSQLNYFAFGRRFDDKEVDERTGGQGSEP